MGRWAALLILGLSLAPLLRADGDSGDLLATPQRYKDGALVDNEPSATIRLGSVSDPLVGKRDGWTALGGAYCYARLTGVGLRGDGKSILYRPFDPPETVSYVSVVCGAESAKSAIGKPLSLTLSLGGHEETQTFTIENPGETRTVTFTFDPTEASDIRLSNDGDTVFEVRRVSWYANLPPITVETTISSATVGGTIHCSIDSCSGGSGSYVRARWTFNGVTSTAIDQLQSIAKFTAPDREGDYPLTLEIIDTLGNSRTFSFTVTVFADAAPTRPAVTDVTRTGFTLSWDRPAGGLTPEEFTVTVSRSGMLSATLAPEWTAGTFWTTLDLSLDEALDGLDAKAISVTVPKGWEGNLSVRVGDGSSMPLERLSNDIFSGFALSPGQTFRLKASNAANPPDSLSFFAATSRTYVKETLPTEGQKLTRTFTGFPPGVELDVTVSARYRKEDGTLTGGDELEFPVTLAPIPRPVATRDAAGHIFFNWTSLDLAPGEDPAISLRLFAETPAKTKLDPGLYLTRVLLTQSKAAKAIALTNTSDSPISLDGKNYTLQLRYDTGKKATWDFYMKDNAGKEIYPLVVPAHGELFILHNKYFPSALPENPVYTSSSILNFSAAGTLVLMHEGTDVNALRPVMDAVVRLPADSLTGAASTPAAQADAKIDALYDPWPQPGPVSAVFYQGTYTPGHSYLDLPALSLTRPEGATRLWVELRTCLDDAESEPQILELWSAPSTTPRPGFRLRLR